MLNYESRVFLFFIFVLKVIWFLKKFRFLSLYVIVIRLKNNAKTSLKL